MERVRDRERDRWMEGGSEREGVGHVNLLGRLRPRFGAIWRIKRYMPDHYSVIPKI